VLVSTEGAKDETWNEIECKATKTEKKIIKEVERKKETYIIA
jgi:hypothetical protein